MTGKILKGAHISEQKFKELVNLFSEDLNATQISKISRLSRITINQYLKKIREAIAAHCEAESPVPTIFSVSWPTSFQFGIVREGHNFFTVPITENQQSSDSTDFVAIADFRGWKLFRLPAHIDANGRPVMDDVSGFWGLAKNRLHKFRGLHKSSVYLHVKECEFRYNYRHEDLQKLLLGILLKN